MPVLFASLMLILLAVPFGIASKVMISSYLVLMLWSSFDSKYTISRVVIVTSFTAYLSTFFYILFGVL